MSTTGTNSREPAQAGGLERPAPGQGKPIAGAVEAREALWLYELNQGASVVQIARRSHLSCRQVQLGVARARKREQERLQSSRDQESRKRDDMQGRNCSSLPVLVRERWSGRIPDGCPGWFPCFRSGRLSPRPRVRITGQSGPAPCSAAWFVPGPAWTAIRPSSAIRAPTPGPSRSRLRRRRARALARPVSSGAAGSMRPNRLCRLTGLVPLLPHRWPGLRAPETSPLPASPVLSFSLRPRDSHLGL